MNVNWENKIKSSLPYTNVYKNVKYNKNQEYKSYNIKIHEMEENPYIFNESEIPLNTDEIHKNIMYANKQDKQNIHFKHYKTRKQFKSPAPTSFNNKFLINPIEEDNKIEYFEVLNEKNEYKPKRLEFRKNLQATINHKLENPIHQDKTYSLDRYYFI